MIIGRKREQEGLERIFQRRKSQFITIYGRMRVGKTYLIQEFFTHKKCIFLQATGIQHGKLKDQLENFTKAFSKTFFHGAPLETPESWSDAFKLLTKQIEQTDEKVVIFLDELPWMASRKSGLHMTIDFYWNNQWAWMHNVILVLGGSSVPWMRKKIIYNTGGFHNRTTLEINLGPFDLAETKEYLEAKGATFSEEEILYLYFAVGGIPEYLNYIKPDLNPQQNIQHMFFDTYAPLADEFDTLFDAQFDRAEPYKEIVQIIGKNSEGISRTELISKITHSTRGGELTERLKKLSNMGFIAEYIPWKKQRGAYYKVRDEFCLFYTRWFTYPTRPFPPDHWAIENQNPAYPLWANNAFEAVCYKHIHELMRGLDIRTSCHPTSWHAQASNKPDVHIDLMLVRDDDAISICDIQYNDKPISIDKGYAAKLTRTINTLKTQTKTTKQLLLAMITAHGIKPTIYSEELVNHVITAQDLFKRRGY